MELSNAEMLTYSTLRIECDYNDGSGTGTGFFFDFGSEADAAVKLCEPYLITNKHVIENATRGKLTFTLRGPDGKPIDNQHRTIELENFESLWIKHPDPSVDLCGLPIANIVNQSQQEGNTLYYVLLNPSLIGNQPEHLAQLNAIEDIIMVGYPNGIWDSVNNQPIFRKGITATHPAKDYKGKKEFMIDAACYPGSSGSPVFIYNSGSYPIKGGGAMLGDRLWFLGVLYAGPQHTVTGEIRVITIPTAQTPMTFSTIPNNLGFVIKADRVLELKERVSELKRLFNINQAE